MLNKKLLAAGSPALFRVFLVVAVFSILWVQLCFPSLSALCSVPTTADAAVYAIVGKGMMNGLLPYRELFDHKGPLTYLVFGMGSLLTPSSLVGTGFIVSLLLALVLLYAYRAFHLYYPSSSSLLLSFCLPLFLNRWEASPAELGLPCYAYTLYHFLRYWKEGHQRVPWLGLGACVSCLLLFKFNLTAFWVPLLPAMLLREWRHRGGAGCLAAFWRLALGFILPLLPFIAYYGFHENGLASMWDAYVLFSVNYAGQTTPIWASDPESLISGFFGNDLFHPMSEVAVYVKMILALVAILTGFVALCWKPFRHMLFPADTWVGVSAFVLSFLLLFVASFSGPYNWTHYYVVFLPFYFLTLCAFGYTVRAWFTPRLGLLLMGCLMMFSWAAYAYQTSKAVKGRNSYPEIVCFIREHRHDSLIIYPPSLGTVGYYVNSACCPVVRYFYPPAAGGAESWCDEDIAGALAEGRCRYFLYDASSGRNLESPAIIEALAAKYRLTACYAHVDGAPKLYVYECRSETSNAHAQE